MLQKFNGIILRTVNYSESSVICDIYTQELGLNTFIINGVRKKNAKVGTALVRTMSMVAFIAYYKKDAKMNRIKEIRPGYTYLDLPMNVYKGAIGLFMIELIQKSIKESEQNTTLYAFITDVFIKLDQYSSRINNFTLWFLVRFALQLGILTSKLNVQKNEVYDYSEGILRAVEEGAAYCFSAQNTNVLGRAIQMDFSDFMNQEIDRTDRKKFINSSIQLFHYHLPSLKKLNALDVLMDVFEAG